MIRLSIYDINWCGALCLDLTIAYPSLISFAAMVIQKKDLYGLWYPRLEYFAWVQVLLLWMEFRTCGVLKYDASVSFDSVENFAYAFHFIIKSYPKYSFHILYLYYTASREHSLCCIGDWWVDPNWRCYSWKPVLFICFSYLVMVLVDRCCWLSRCFTSCCYKGC